MCSFACMSFRVSCLPSARQRVRTEPCLKTCVNIAINTVVHAKVPELRTSRTVRTVRDVEVIHPRFIDQLVRFFIPE